MFETIISDSVYSEVEHLQISQWVLLSNKLGPIKRNIIARQIYFSDVFEIGAIEKIKDAGVPQIIPWQLQILYIH